LYQQTTETGMLFSCFARCFTILQPAVLTKSVPPATNFLKPNNFKFQKQNYKVSPNTPLLLQHAFQYITKMCQMPVYPASFCDRAITWVWIL